MKFYLDKWKAIAPGLYHKDEWSNWLANQDDRSEASLDINLKSIPAMVRRRFGELGKCAVGASLPLLDDDESIPAIFSSRHGESKLTHSILSDIGKNEPVSPTTFSLAVHNSISGLFSIARKDISATTALAPGSHIVFQTLCEVIGQLEKYDRLLCIIYDGPLAEFFAYTGKSSEFPFAVAMIFSRTGANEFEMSPSESPSQDADLETEVVALLKLLSGLTQKIQIGNRSNSWDFVRSGLCKEEC